MKKIISIIVLFILLVIIGVLIFSKEINITSYKNQKNKQEKQIIKTAKTGVTYFIYFTGIRCPHCAKVDPILLGQKLRDNNIMVIEYEIHRESLNAPLIIIYNDKYKTGLGIPLLIAGDGKAKIAIGDKEILYSLDKMIFDNQENDILLPNNKVSFETLDISEMPGLPKIWYQNRLAIKKNILSKENTEIKDFLIKGIIPEINKNSDKKEVILSGQKVIFGNAVEINGWILMYN
jgi:hypothetical protein